MRVLHITQGSDGYEVVTLLANAVNRKNNLSVIQKDNGEIFYTGGFLINDTPEIRQVLNAMPNEKQYEFIYQFKMNPFVKFYFEEEKHSGHNAHDRENKSY